MIKVVHFENERLLFSKHKEPLCYVEELISRNIFKIVADIVPISIIHGWIVLLIKTYTCHMSQIILVRIKVKPLSNVTGDLRGVRRARGHLCDQRQWLN